MTKSRTPSTNPKNNSLRFFHLGALVFCVLLVAFCIRWQIVEANKFAEISKNRTYSSPLTSQRGSIYSSDGTTLAYSEPRFDMFIWMDDLLFFEEKGLQTRQEFLNKVAPIIDMTSEELGNKIASFYVDQGVKWIPIAKSLTKDKWERLNALKTDKFSEKELSGFIFETTSIRVYPEGRLASHLIGLTNKVNDRIVGQGGIEESYNGVLNPIDGFVIQETDAIGQTITTSLLPTIEPKNGSDVYTTINKKLQTVVEKMIKEGVEKYDASSGSVLVMDPKTGSILALANYPDYDPNLREEKEPGTYVNSAVTAPYEAGSVGKTLTLATAIDLGLVSADTIIQPEGHQGCEKFTNDLPALCTWDKKPQGPQTASQCLVKSDNICFLHISELIPRKEYYSYLDKFGVGKPSGADIITQDSYGILKDYTEWNVADVAAFSYGHGYQVNLIQIGDYISTLANHGVRMKPRIVDKIISSDGSVKEYKPIVVERAVKAETADEMARLMGNNYQASFAANERFYNDLKNNYNISVKSGTALIATATGYSNDINATFVGFDASEERTFVMVVKLERPLIPYVDRLAFYNVRPLWLDTFNAIKDIIGVPRK